MYMYQMTLYTGLHGGGWKMVLTPSIQSHLTGCVPPTPRFSSQYGMTQEIQYQNT